MKKLYSKYKIEFILSAILVSPFIFFFSLRVHDTGMFPFQSKSVECQMKGRQTFLRSYAEYAPRLTFPRNFQIKFKFLSFEYLEGSNKFPLTEKGFMYGANTFSYKISRSYNEFGDQYHVVFWNEDLIDYAFVDYLTAHHDLDVDATYRCSEINHSGA
tara:strand:+ start:357 stop:830 length:474 start_codon:yes stop_codon:yes gene_type:complete